MTACSIDHCGAEFGRGAAFDLFKRPVEGGNTRKAGFESDIGNTHARVHKEGFGQLYPFNGQEVHKGHVGIAFEKMSKVGSADADLNRNIVQG